MSQNVPINEASTREAEGSSEPLRKLSKREEEGALLVAQDEISDEEIAKRCRIDRRTLTRWKKDPAFDARVNEHLEDIVASLRRFAIAKPHKQMARRNRDYLRLQRMQEARIAAAEEQLETHLQIQAELDPLMKHREVLLDRRRQRQDVAKHALPDLDDDRPAVDEVAEAEEAELATISDRIHALRMRDPGDVHPGQLEGEMIKVVTYLKNGERIEWQTDRPLLAELRALEDQANDVINNHVKRLEVSGPGGKPIEVDADGGYSDEERAARIAALLERARARRDREAPEGSAPAA